MNSSRIIIKKTQEIRINGKPVKLEEEFYKCWTEIQDLIGNELYNALSIKLENTIIFKVRWCKKIEELRKYKDFKVYFEGNKYEIYQVDYAKYYRKYILIKAKMVD